jgi:hypothetical protein
MKASLVLIIAASETFFGCSSNSYPGSGQYPDARQYPYPGNQHPYPGNQYPYPNYPTRGGRNDEVIVTKDGRVIDRNGRVVGTARNLPPGQAKKLYGSKSARDYAHEGRRDDDRYDNRRYDNNRYENGNRDQKWNGKGKRYDND